MTPNSSAEAKRKFIELRQEILLRRIGTAEKSLYREVLSRFLDRLDVDDGQIISNDSNVSLVQAIDIIFSEFQKKGYVDIIRQFTGDMFDITAHNAEYFRILGEAKERIPAAQQSANNRLKKQLGLTENGAIKQNGYLDRLVKDKAVLKSIKQVVYKGISAKVDLKTMQEDLQLVIEGNDKINGQLTRHLNTFLLDSYQQHDRSAAEIFAKDIGLKAAIYAGGKIKSTRCFCEKNNGKVFTIEEMLKWSEIVNESCGPIWNADKDGKYDPIKMMGGYGCRHSVDWINASLAVRLRPDLKGLI